MHALNASLRSPTFGVVAEGLLFADSDDFVCVVGDEGFASTANGVTNMHVASNRIRGEKATGFTIEPGLSNAAARPGARLDLETKKVRTTALGCRLDA